MTKALAILFLILSIHHVEGQYYVRTKKNLGVIGMYNFGTSNSSHTSNALEPSFQVGLCRQIGKYAVPELGIKVSQNALQNNSAQIEGLFADVHFRKNLLKLNQRKKGAKCKAEVLECFITPEYHYLFNAARIQDKNQVALRYGLGLYHLESGGSKKSRAWLTKVEVYHRNNLVQLQNSLNLSPAPLNNEFGIALRIQHFKTYDFLK